MISLGNVKTVNYSFFLARVQYKPRISVLRLNSVEKEQTAAIESIPTPLRTPSPPYLPLREHSPEPEVESVREEVEEGGKKWGPKKLDLSLDEEIRKQILAEVRRKKAFEMYEQLRRRNTTNKIERESSSSDFEDCELLC